MFRRVNLLVNPQQLADMLSVHNRNAGVIFRTAHLLCKIIDINHALFLFLADFAFIARRDDPRPPSKVKRRKGEKQIIRPATPADHPGFWRCNRQGCGSPTSAFITGPNRIRKAPSWLTFLGHMKDSLWGMNLFRCESASLQ